MEETKFCFAYAREVHKITNAEHYHVAIRINPSQRWKTATEFLHENCGIVANFACSPKGGMYADKEDPKIFYGYCLENDPEQSMIGKNKFAAFANAVSGEKCKSINEDLEIASHQNTIKKLEPKRMDKFDIVEYMRIKKIVTFTELMTAAESRKEARDP